MLTQKVIAFINSNNLISPQDHIIVALSGGRDSITLLYLLHSIKKKINISLSAVHINHGLRGKESDGEEGFVKSTCAGLGVACSVHQLTGFAGDVGENALRKARYEKFEQEIVKFKNSKIATAHHLDDQLETYLMRLFKGSGPKGLMAIPAKRGDFIRPLLEISREEINRFCRENKIRFRDDSSNFVDDKLRNNIRKNLTPSLEKVFGEKYLSAFAESHSKYRGYYSEYRQVNVTHFEKYLNKKAKQVCIDKQDYLAFLKNKKLHFLEYCFSCIYGLPFTIRASHIIAFEAFVDSAKSGAIFNFSKNSKVLVDRTKIIFFVSPEKLENFWELNAGQNVKIGDYFVSLLRSEKVNEGDRKNRWIEYIDGRSLQLPLKLRFWREGDSFVPLGTKWEKKVSDFFIDQKLNVLEKNKVMLILSGETIIWLAGLRLSEQFKVAEETDIIYKIEIKML